jgi:hypothetical protein
MKTDLHVVKRIPNNKMSTTAIIKASNANIAQLSVTEAKRNKAGGTSVQFKYDNQSFSMRLPLMNFPGGILETKNDKGDVSYSLIGSLKGCDPFAKTRSENSDDMAKFYNFLLDLQEKLIQAATENSSKWFGKKRSEESIRDSFNTRSILSVSSDKVGNEYVPNGKYPPSFKVKIPVYENRVCMDAVDASAKPIFLTVDSLRSVFPKGVAVDMIVNGSIYVIGQSFGVTWRITMAQVFQQTRLTAASVFEAVPETTQEEEDAPVQEAQVEVPVAAEAAPEPPAPNRKRRVAAPV